MTVKKVAVLSHTDAHDGSRGLAARQAAAKGTAGLNTLCTLLANSRSVMVQGRWWCACGQTQTMLFNQSAASYRAS